MKNKKILRAMLEAHFQNLTKSTIERIVNLIDSGHIYALDDNCLNDSNFYLTWFDLDNKNHNKLDNIISVIDKMVTTN